MTPQLPAPTNFSRTSVSYCLSTFIFLVLAAILCFSVVYTGEKENDTDALTMTLPSGWKLNTTSQPLTAVGPAGEQLQLFVKTVKGAQNPEAAAEVLAAVEKKIAATMQNTATNQGYLTVAPLQASTSATGTTVQEILSKSKDGKQIMAQFTLRGPNSIALATYEAPASQLQSLQEIRQALGNITWK